MTTTSAPGSQGTVSGTPATTAPGPTHTAGAQASSWFAWWMILVALVALALLGGAVYLLVRRRGRKPGPPGSGPPQARLCLWCGATVEPDAKFCGKCGRPAAP